MPLFAQDEKYLASLHDSPGQVREAAAPAQEIGDQPVSWSGAGKVLGIITAIVIYSVTAYAWISSIDHKVDMIRQEQQIAHTAIDKQLESLTVGQEANRQTTQELKETLIKTNLILQQIAEKK